MISFVLQLLVVLGLFYVLAPLSFMATHRQRPVQTRRLDPNEAPPEVDEAIADWRSEFGESRLPLAAVHALEGGGAHVLHLVEPGTGLHALDYLTPQYRWQVFLSRFADGREVVTTNYPLGVTFTPHPQVHAVRLPGMRTLRRLHGLHRAHVARVMGHGARAAVPTHAELANFVADHELETLERQRELGSMVRVRGVYRPTLRGAFLSVWRRLPPLRWIHSSRDARLAQSLRAEIR